MRVISKAELAMAAAVGAGRLRDVHHLVNTADVLTAGLAELEAENERLRAALEEYAEVGSWREVERGVDTTKWAAPSLWVWDDSRYPWMVADEGLER